VAERLRREGVADEPFLRALAYHTLGHPDLDRAGRALYAADFLEPGREGEGEAWRADLRRRFPEEPDSVVTEIVRARILHLVERGRPVRSETVAFWNSLAEGEAWARASEV
jgi:2-amino-4-hydroxy-6-hydroxymethyldihydropteridine diphosphokinase